MSNRTTLPRRKSGLRLQKSESGAVLLDDRGRQVGTMDPTAAALWELCDGATTPDEIVDAVCEVWAINAETARRDVELTLGRLTEAGFLQWSEGATNG